MRRFFPLTVSLLGFVFLLLLLADTDSAESLSCDHAKATGPEQPDQYFAFSPDELLTPTTVYTYYFPAVHHNYTVPAWKCLGLEGQEVEVVTVDPNLPSVLYVGTYDQGIYKSTDFGDNWQQINDGLRYETEIISGIEVDPNDSQTVYAIASHNSGFYHSEDGGQSWHLGGDIGRIPKTLSLHPLSGRLFVGTRALPDLPGGEVYKSDNDGLSWQWVITSQVLANSVVASPLDSSLVCVGGNGLYRSQDGGDSFVRLFDGLTFGKVWAIALHPTNSLTAYMTTSAGMLKTTNEGDDWLPWAADVLRELLVDQHDPEVQYATAYCAGVYISRDEGRNWRSMNVGLGNLCANDLVLDSTSTHLYAATEDGIWAIDLIE